MNVNDIREDLAKISDLSPSLPGRDTCSVGVRR